MVGCRLSAHVVWYMLGKSVLLYQQIIIQQFDDLNFAFLAYTKLQIHSIFYALIYFLIPRAPAHLIWL